MREIRRRAVLAAGVMLPGLAWATEPQRAAPLSVITSPPRDFSPGAPPMIDPDPDVLIVDNSFASLLIGQELIHRVHTGLEWAEGPAWSAQGQYALFSDVKGDTQYRYIWETRQVTPFRRPSYNSNGNAFDFEGRQLSCQDFFRRVVRWEHDGSLKVLADNFEGRPLNSPNDLAPHPDGSVWFTDPAYGDQLSEGHPNQAGEPMNQDGRFDPMIGNGGTGLIGRDQAGRAAQCLSVGPRRPAGRGGAGRTWIVAQWHLLLSRLQTGLSGARLRALGGRRPGIEGG